MLKKSKRTPTKRDRVCKLAKMAGWSLKDRSRDFSPVTWVHPKHGEVNEKDLPDFMGSYDVIIPLIQSQPIEVREWIYNCVSGSPVRMWMDFSPSKWSHLLLCAVKFFD